jgi:hypothetical protein
MKAVSSSETSGNIYQTSRCNIPEDSHLLTHFNFGIRWKWLVRFTLRLLYSRVISRYSLGVRMDVSQRESENGDEEKHSTLLEVLPLSSSPCFFVPAFTYLSVRPYEHVGTRCALSAHTLMKCKYNGMNCFIISHWDLNGRFLVYRTRLAIL